MTPTLRRLHREERAANARVNALAHQSRQRPGAGGYITVAGYWPAVTAWGEAFDRLDDERYRVRHAGPRQHPRHRMQPWREPPGWRCDDGHARHETRLQAIEDADENERQYYAGRI